MPRHLTSQRVRWALLLLPRDFSRGAATQCSYSKARLRAGIAAHPHTHSPTPKVSGIDSLLSDKEKSLGSDAASSGQLLFDTDRGCTSPQPEPRAWRRGREVQTSRAPWGTCYLQRGTAGGSRTSRHRASCENRRKPGWTCGSTWGVRTKGHLSSRTGGLVPAGQSSAPIPPTAPARGLTCNSPRWQPWASLWCRRCRCRRVYLESNEDTRSRTQHHCNQSSSWLKQKVGTSQTVHSAHAN